MTNTTVLVVDDNVNDRIIAETLLQARGFRVLTAEDGAEARDIVDREAVAVVVTELALPGINGWQLVRWLRGRFEPFPLQQQPRIVVVSGQLEAGTERFMHRLGVDAVLQKPVPAGAFLETVDRLAAQGQRPHAVGEI